MKPTICQDSREHKGKKDHILKAFERYGINVVRSKMYVGDWAVLTNQSVVIDTKQGLSEVYSNLVRDHERFRTECIKAKSAGIRLIVLVEETGIKTLDDVPDWVNPRSIIYERQVAQGTSKQKAPPVSSKRLYNIMRTMSELYGCEWSFCDKEHTGETILHLLGVMCNDNA